MVATSYSPTRVVYIDPRTLRRPQSRDPYIVLPAAPDGQEWVREVGEWAVPDAERRAGRLALSIATEALGISRPVIRWFAPIDGNQTALGTARDTVDRACAGYVYLDDHRAIYVRAGEGTTAVTETVVHECVHVWQSLLWGEIGRYLSDAEVTREKQRREQHAIETTRRILETARGSLSEGGGGRGA